MKLYSGLLLSLAFIFKQVASDYCTDCNRRAVKESLGITHLSDEQTAELFKVIPQCFQHCVAQAQGGSVPQAQTTKATTTSTTTTTPRPSLFGGLFNQFGGRPGRFGGRRRKRTIPASTAKCMEWELREAAEEHIFKCMNNQQPIVNKPLDPVVSKTTTTTGSPLQTVPSTNNKPLDIFGFLNPGANKGGGGLLPGGGGAGNGGGFFNSFLGGGSNPLAGMFGAGGGGGGGGGSDLLSGFLPSGGGSNPLAGLLGGGAAKPPGGNLFGSFLGGGAGGGGGGPDFLSGLLGGRKKRAAGFDNGSVFHQMMMLAYTNELIAELCPTQKKYIGECLAYVGAPNKNPAQPERLQISNNDIQLDFLNPQVVRESYCAYRLDNNCLYCRHKRQANAEHSTKVQFCDCYDNMVTILSGRCGNVPPVQDCVDLTSGGSDDTRTLNAGGGHGDDYSHLTADDVCSSQYQMPTVHTIIGG